MSGVLEKGLLSLKTDHELTSYLEDILESQNYPTWTSDAASILLTWIEKLLQDGNVLCANSITRVLYYYVKHIDTSEIPSVIQIYLRLNNFVDLSVKWETNDFITNVAFWESVNELHLILVGSFSSLFREYMIPLGSVLLKTCLDENITLFLRLMKIKALNACLENSSHQHRNVFRTSNPKCIEKLFDALDEVGDYDFQTSLIEAVFRLTSSSERSLLVGEWLSRVKCVVQHLFVRIKDFEPDCRKFLNAYNAELGARKKVFTFPALQAQIGNFILRKPNIPTYEHLWVDFNLGSSTISLLFDRSENCPVSSPERFWETIIIYSHEVETVMLNKFATGYSLSLTIGRDAALLFSSPPSQNVCDLLSCEFKICFKTVIPSLEELCRTLYKEKLKIGENEENLAEIQISAPCRKESISASFINNARCDINENVNESESKEENPVCDRITEPSEFGKVSCNKRLNSQSTPSELITAQLFHDGYSASSSSFTQTNDSEYSKSAIKKLEYINSVTDVAHKSKVRSSKPIEETIDRLVSSSIQSNKRSLSSDEKALLVTPSTRVLANQNLSSGSTTLYPFPKLRQIIKDKRTPPKKKNLKKKGSTTLSKSVSLDHNLYNLINIVPTKIRGTNEVQNVDVSSDEDIIPATFANASHTSNARDSNDITGDSVMSPSTDEDIIPSSLVKDSTMKENTNVISLSDVSVVKKNILKCLEKSMSLNSISSETTSKEKEREMGSHMLANTISKEVVSHKSDVIKDRKNLMEESIKSPKVNKDLQKNTNNSNSSVSKDQNTSATNSVKDASAIIVYDTQDLDIPKKDNTNTNEDDSPLNINASDIEYSLFSVDELEETDHGNEASMICLNKSIPTEDEPNKSYIIIKNVNDISFTEELVSDSTVGLERFDLKNNGNNEQFKLQEVNIENVRTDVQQNDSHTNFKENIANESNSDKEHEKHEIENHDISNQLYVEATNTQEFQNVIDVPKSLVEEECINIPVEVTDVIEKILTQVKERENFSDSVTSCLNKLTQMNEETTSEIKDNVINYVDSAQQDMDNSKIIAKLTEVNLSENGQLSAMENINRAFLVAFGPTIIVNNTLGDTVELHNKNDNSDYDSKGKQKFNQNILGNPSDEILTENNLKTRISQVMKHSTPNKSGVLTIGSDVDDSNANVDKVNTKKSPSEAVALTLKILSEYPLKYPTLKTPKRVDRVYSDSADSANESRKSKRRGKTRIPDHYDANTSATNISTYETKGSSKKKLFSTTDSILEATPPEQETIEIVKIEHHSFDKDTTNKETTELKAKRVEKSGKNNAFKIFRSKQKEKKLYDKNSNLKPNETIVIQEKSIAEKSAEKCHHSIFSDFGHSDSSTSEKWLRKKPVIKSSLKTYPGKYRKRSYREESSESDEWEAKKKKNKRKNRVPARPYTAKDSASEAEDLRLFRSPVKKFKGISQDTQQRRIITRSMTNNQSSQNKANFRKYNKTKPKKRTFFSFVETLDSTNTSPEVMRDTSLSQAASSIDDTPQIANFKLVDSKKCKKRKSSPANLDNHDTSEMESQHEDLITDLKYDITEGLKYDLPSSILECSLDSNLKLPPNPPNTPTLSEDNGPICTLKSNVNLYDGAGISSLPPPQPENFGPKSTSSPRFSYVAETHDSYGSSKEDSIHTNKSPAFNDKLNSKLYFSLLEVDSAEKSVEYFCKGDNMIPTRPNSDYSSSEEMSSSCKDLLNKSENDKSKTGSKKNILYVRKKGEDLTEVCEKKDEDLMSPLVSPSLNILSSPSQRSEMNFLPHSLCQDQYVQSLANNDYKPKLSKLSKSKVKTNRQEIHTTIIRNKEIDNKNPLLISMTPPSSFNQESLKTPLKLVPKALFESLPNEVEPHANNEATVDSYHPGSRTNFEMQEDEKNEDNEYVYVHSSTLRLLLDDVRLMKESFIQESHRCSVIVDVLKSMLNSKLDKSKMKK